eukprot:GHVU01204882.1.p3 GENE.GHVU01204882.1~~GHVU01204882.1.p3  ORF type:complete len:122 (+),score=21.25 GHVU01204882.1:664-1029(+)
MEPLHASKGHVGGRATGPPGEDYERTLGGRDWTAERRPNEGWRRRDPADGHLIRHRADPTKELRNYSGYRAVDGSRRTKDEGENPAENDVRCVLVAIITTTACRWMGMRVVAISLLQPAAS